MTLDKTSFHLTLPFFLIHYSFIFDINNLKNLCILNVILKMVLKTLCCEINGKFWGRLFHTKITSLGTNFQPDFHCFWARPGLSCNQLIVSE